MAEELLDTDAVLAYARRIAHGEIEPEALLADASVSSYDRRNILALALYSIEYDAAKRDRRSGRQRRAMRLLCSMLSWSQRAQLRRSGHSFLVRGSLGNVYRLMPRVGMVWRVERRGCRWRSIASYCLHDYAADDPAFVSRGLPNEGTRSLLPPADITMGHMLLLSADECEFRRRANESIRYGAPLRVHWLLAQERRQIDRESADVAQDAAAA